MASLRKKYSAEGPRHDGPPVTAPPTGAAKLPDPVADSKPPEMPATESPVDKAAKEAIALQLRLKEMERAEQLNHEAAQQPPPPQAAEPQQQPQQPAMPAHVATWLAEHPQYMDPNDAVAQAEIHLATVKCMRDGKTWNDSDFIPTIERHLGIAPRTNGSQHRPPPAPAAPVRQQQRSTVPMGAPPHRDVPSMTTGRPASRRAPLTAEEVEAARFSGITPERYAEEKEKMLRLRAAGQLQDGR